MIFGNFIFHLEGVANKEYQLIMIIRSGTYQDISQLLELGRRMHSESVYSFLPYDDEKVRRLIITFIEEPDTYCGFVAEDNGKIAGMIGAFIIDYFFCNERLVSDMVLFIDKPYRRGLTSARLILRLKQWAVAQGARELALGASSGIKVEKIGRLYERLGFTRVGGLYKLSLSKE